ncbi:hypothetical protein V5D56_17560 [Cellulosimicrobium sp. PMB13]|uniref:hypothetical protein n=1 Tax=Cellulosimicrobium sp. PMB13 TaxID=3120158 RepID=UPI003F4C2DC0
MPRISEPVLARTVTYGVVCVLLATAAAGVEAWPLTSYRLFSGVRTDARTALELVAVGVDGPTVVRPDPTHPVLATTTYRYDDLAPASPAEREELVRAWLDTAGIDPADVASVRLDRVRSTLDPETLEWTEVSREPVLEVLP